ncbi:SusC/RagA family TonB-linked outer membrane protein [Arachidicoccus ginsenosidimutans]|uniref:SusC/RagA family TonB-linked outer membrane protein n=1 Tax=Arachidicoccus sp. BS20 TaxID=1850526 RepID=UPI0018D4D043|nr:SusC/RagA family TonB-linked outer membrane protein [Arachidicoccus sp. BS20]
MKLTAIFLLAACMTVSAKVKSQTVTLDVKNAPVQSVFREIIRQTGASIIYNESLFSKEAPVTIKITDASIKEALTECLKSSSLTFDIENNTIIIKRKRDTPSPSAPAAFYNGPLPVEIVHGRVADTTGNPLDGASVEVHGSMTGRFVTNANGEFEISGLQQGDTLIASYIGYIDKTVIYRGNNYIYIPLRISQNVLDEAVVQAYGTTSRRYSVGSISTISAEDIEKQPVTNVALALQGRVPGLYVTPRGGGIPGAIVGLQVRGQNTLISNPSDNSTSTNLLRHEDQPLIIVDGIPTASQNVNPTQFLNSFIAGSGGLSPINGLNPADVESISVLKDADATSIYGSQGANGVIVITTKRGKAGKTQLNLNVNTGPNSPTENMKMLNTQQYLQLRHDAINLDDLDLTTIPSYQAASFADILNFDTTKYTDWVKKFFNKTPLNTDVHASVSGGTNNDTYILSGGYTRAGYNLPGDFADNRFTFHSGAHHTSLNHKFTLDFGTDLSYDKNNSSVPASAGQAMTLVPDYPDFFTPSGDLVWNYNGIGLNQIFAGLKEPYNIQQFQLSANLKADYEIISGLRVGVLAGYSRSDNKEYSASPISAQDPSNQYAISSASFGQSVSQTIDIEPQLNFRRYIGKGILTVLAGGTWKKAFGYSNTQYGTDYPDDALLNSIQGAKTVTYSDNSTIYKYTGAFARLNYVYANKYIINLTGRRDGSSNFGPSHQFGNFGSAGMAWIFSEEGWFKRALPFISFGKLSGDYGTNGTDGVQSYMYQAYYKIYNSSPSQFQNTVPLIPNNLYNPDYTWASKHALNLHIDLGLFKDRVLLGGSWYQNRTGNQLTSYPLPAITGFNSVVENMKANVQDRGVEFTLSTKNIQHKNFSWNTTFNISTNRNKLLSFPGLANSSYSGTYEIGKSVTLLRGFKYAGINDTTGVFQFYKGDGKTITAPTGLIYTSVSKGGDQVIIGNSEPKFYGGFGNDFTYKGISLSIFFQFSKSYARNYLTAIYNGGGGPGYMANYPDFVLGKVWLNPGDAAKGAIFQRPTTGASYTTLASQAQSGAYYFASSSGAYSDDTYMRLKTLSISYTLPPKWVKAMHMTNFSIYVNAQNVLTFTDYKVGDPELPGQLYGIPTQRTFQGGLSMSF